MWNVNCKCFPPQRETDPSRGDSRRRGSSGKIPGANILTANTRTATTPTRTRRNTRTGTSTDRIQRRMSTYAMSGWVSKCGLRMIFLLCLGGGASEAVARQVWGVGGRSRGGRRLHQPRRREWPAPRNCLKAEKQVLTKVFSSKFVKFACQRFENMAIAEPTPPKAPKKYQVKRFKVIHFCLIYCQWFVDMHVNKLNRQAFKPK